MNEGVRNALREAFKLKDADLIIPEHYAWLGAVGAAMLESEEYRKRSFKRIHQLRQHEATRKNFACTDPLSMENVLLLRNRNGKKVSGGRWQVPGKKEEQVSGVRCQVSEKDTPVDAPASPDTQDLTPAPLSDLRLLLRAGP